MAKSTITVSRLWNNPKIHTIVDFASEGGISLQMNMDDFVAALKAEIGAVTLKGKGQSHYIAKEKANGNNRYSGHRSCTGISASDHDLYSYEY